MQHTTHRFHTQGGQWQNGTMYPVQTLNEGRGRWRGVKVALKLRTSNVLMGVDPLSDPLERLGVRLTGTPN